MKDQTYQIADRVIGSLRPYARNARSHSRKQIKQIARSIERFGLPRLPSPAFGVQPASGS